jgi:hypothetical protein
MIFTGGLPETPCGVGSMIQNTANVRLYLPQLLKRHEVETLIDAPCGDCNWISRSHLGAINYTGIDNDCMNLAAAVKRQWVEQPASRTFIVADLLRVKLPNADAIMCRDFLQHISFKNAAFVIEKLKKSAKLILMTSHHNDVNEEVGDNYFRPLNLCKPPFSLPEPKHVISDGRDRILGMWQASAI